MVGHFGARYHLWLKLNLWWEIQRFSGGIPHILLLRVRTWKGLSFWITSKST